MAQFFLNPNHIVISDSQKVLYAFLETFKGIISSHFFYSYNSLNFASLVFFCYSDVDDVHEMMDDIQEQTELSDEISRAISEPAGFGMDYDEVSWIFMCLQSLLYLQMAIYLLSKLMECCANLLYSTLIIVITKLF